MTEILETKKAMILRAAAAIGAEKWTPAEIDQLRTNWPPLTCALHSQRQQHLELYCPTLAQSFSDLLLFRSHKFISLGHKLSFASRHPSHLVFTFCDNHD